MNEKRFAPCNLGRSTISLGKQGEANHLRIEFDCSGWLAEYPDALVTLYYFAPEREENNPIRPVLGEEGTDRVWIVSEADTLNAGNGVIELVLEDAFTGAKLKSVTGYTTVIYSPSAMPLSEGGGDTGTGSGEDGGYYKPSVSSSGVLSWQPSKAGMPSVASANIKGPTGATGATGPQGPTGATGPAGPAGEDGKDGETGPQGPAGPAGADGKDGVSPTITVTSITGGHRVTITDANGTKYFDVMDGAAGSGDGSGAAGKDGFSPIVSVITIDGGHRISITDASGTSEFDVMDGEDGAQGPAGPQGEPGATGATGPKGDKGDKGERGETGATGAQGPQGEKGEKGETGATGAQGPQGEKGETGATGPQGPQGETGPQGIQGEKGDTGPQGPAGSIDNLPIASADTLGGVQPVAKTDDMTQSVGVDDAGGLWTMAGGSGGGGFSLPLLYSVTTEEEVRWIDTGDNAFTINYIAIIELVSVATSSNASDYDIACSIHPDQFPWSNYAIFSNHPGIAKTYNKMVRAVCFRGDDGGWTSVVSNRTTVNDGNFAPVMKTTGSKYIPITGIVIGDALANTNATRVLGAGTTLKVWGV